MPTRPSTQQAPQNITARRVEPRLKIEAGNPKMLRSWSRFLPQCPPNSFRISGFPADAFSTYRGAVDFSPHFFLNGNCHFFEDPLPFLTYPLSSYLRDIARTTSVKIGCEEGGCGACTVLTRSTSPFCSEDNPDSELKIETIGSCVVPLATVLSCEAEIVTLEGLNDAQSEGMRLIQESFCDFGASQCGFCTPGFELALYGILMSPDDDDETLATSLAGNLCRCTGYRSILDAAEFVQSQFSKEEELRLPVWQPQQLDGEKEKTVVLSSLAGDLWVAPIELDEVLQYCAKPGFDVICGATELLVESNLGHVRLERSMDTDESRGLVLTSRVRGEMSEVGYCEDEDSNLVLRVGASVSVACLKRFCGVEKEGKEHGSLESAIYEQLSRFGSVSIRNLATIGGNLANASPTSDLSPIWLACNAKVNLASSERGRRTLSIHDFFLTAKTVNMESDEVIVSIDVPCCEERREMVFAYKQSRRREDDIAILAACFRIEVDAELRILDSGFGFGCLDSVPICVDALSRFVNGKMLNEELLGQVLERANVEIRLDDDAPGGMVQYRLSLVQSFLRKFFMTLLSFHGFAGQGVEEFETWQRSATQSYQPIYQGTSVGRPSNSLHSVPQTSGEAEFLDDIRSYPDELFAHPVISRVPRGILISVDPSSVLEIPGVVAWIDSRDIPGKNVMGIDEELIVAQEITSVGQVLGLVLATDRHVAREGASKVSVEVEELEPILTIDEAIRADSFFSCHPRLGKGDLDSGFAQSDNIVTKRCSVGSQDHFYLETQRALALPREDDVIHVISSSQGITHVQEEIQEVLGLPAHKVIVKAGRLGGGFGGKESRGAFYAALAAVAAHKVNRPVRLVVDRHTDMLSSGMRHPFMAEFTVGFTNDGTIHALEVDLFSDGGFSTDLSCFVMERAVVVFDNFYDIPNLSVTGHVCQTNKPSNTAMRGFGAPQALFVGELVMDEVSRALSMHPTEIREKHTYESGDVTPYGDVLEDCHASRVWDECLEWSSFWERGQEVSEFNDEHTFRKRGIYIMPAKFGMCRLFDRASSLVHVYKDGSVLISHGGVEMGQGLHTKVAQVAASTFGIPLDRIQIHETATDKCINTLPTAASSGTDMNAMATKIACEEILTRLQPIIDDLGGYANWDDVILKADQLRVNLTGQGHFSPPGLATMDWETGEGTPCRYYIYSAAACEVEIDSLTGDHRLLRTDIVFDVGDSINPKIDIGQIEGGFLQGYGWNTLEEVVWDSSSGDLITRGPGAYKIPTTDDVPLEFNVQLLSNTSNPHAVFSSKGVGEPPFLLSVGVYFALKNAISEARKEAGIADWNSFDLGHPVTAERIRLACCDVE